MSSGTVSAEEIEKFGKLASRWWDPNGPMKPLHQMNPARIEWILSVMAAEGHSSSVVAGEGPNPGVAAGEGPYPDVAAGEGPNPGVAAGEGPYPDVAAGEGPYPDVAAGEGPYPDVAAGEGLNSDVAAGEGPPTTPSSRSTVERVDGGLASATRVPGASSPATAIPSRSTRILDVGCGAGLASEELARHGNDVLGIDAAGEAIHAARAHAEGQGLRLTYRSCLAEDLAAEGRRFPVITALEVIEHVPDPAAFVRVLAGLSEPGGLVVLSTLNRTKRSWIVGKLGAEYVLRMLPVGTHDWKSFIAPAELAGMMRSAGLRVCKTTGLSVDPRTGQWRTGRDMSVNYMIAGVR